MSSLSKLEADSRKVKEVLTKEGVSVRNADDDEAEGYTEKMWQKKSSSWSSFLLKFE